MGGVYFHHFQAWIYVTVNSIYFGGVGDEVKMEKKDQRSSDRIQLRDKCYFVLLGTIALTAMTIFSMISGMTAPKRDRTM